MNAKTMEGLAGASASVRMISTPMNIAKEAERKGDMDKMQRALNYASGLAEQAGEYSEKTSQGMKLDAKEAQEQKKQQQEELIEKQRTKRKEQEEAQKAKQEEAIEASRAEGDTDAKEGTPIGDKGAKEPSFDTAQISEEGIKFQALSQTPSASLGEQPGAAYTPSGEVQEAALEAGGTIDVSV